MIYRFLFFAAITLTLTSCQTKSDNEILNEEDYNMYLNSDENPSLEKAMAFKNKWKKTLEKDSLGLGNLQFASSGYSQLFGVTGNISYLDTAAVLQKRAHKVAADLYKSGTARSMARTYISQHNFKAAKDTLIPRFEKGTKKELTELMLFDVHMELAEYDEAKQILDTIKNNQNYEYLIRAAKWNDHNGNLESAISLLEKAQDKAEQIKSKPLQIWTHSNLGDFYGHAGRIKDAYNSYLKTLELDPDNAHVKKGLAWIAYSYEKNPEEAIRILDSVQKTYNTPDFHLLRAEIAEFQGNTQQKQNELDAYWQAVNKPSYGAMYNAYNVVYFADDKKDYDKALQVAKADVDNRPTPEAYQNLAYANLKAGNKEKALDIIEQHVIGKTYEPKALFHAALIYKANGMEEEAQKLKEDELMGTAFEMGPVAYERIKNI